MSAGHRDVISAATTLIAGLTGLALALVLLAWGGVVAIALLAAAGSLSATVARAALHLPGGRS